MGLEHSFDSKGFQFAAKIFLACIAVGTAGHLGLLYADETRPALVTEPSLVVIRETPFVSTADPTPSLTTLLPPPEVSPQPAGAEKAALITPARVSVATPLALPPPR